MPGIEELLKVVARLRAPGGCPWDIEQTHESIRSQLIEECYELVEAIESADDIHMKEELGDVLLHVVFHAQIAKERKAFEFEDVTHGIVEKLIRRHPHVFGEKKLDNSAQVLSKWQELKEQEKPERTSVLDGIPKALPALMEAQQVQKRAGRVGFDWQEITPVLAKIREEIQEVEDVLDNKDKLEDEIGDLLFAVVNLARHAKLDAEQACRRAVDKFRKRFQEVEKRVQADGTKMKELSADELETYWVNVKEQES